MQQKPLLITAIAFGILVAGVGMWYFTRPDTGTTINTVSNQAATNTATNTKAQLTAADRAGKQLSGGRCEGTDKPKLTDLPMNIEDFSMILPYGLVVGGHVTPIDHQYFSPTNFQSAPDTYDVYAMADARIVDIGTRQHPGFGPNANLTVTDYRLVFTISCRLFYYYDLVTSLAPDIKVAFDDQGREIDLPVKAGQLIGKIGGQTLDFAVWDTDKPLTGFIVPEHYGAETWKVYTADPLDYYTDELKAQALSKYIRVAEPVSGKIDYDVDGRLIGNWFQQGTNGYKGVVGEGNGEYWVGHLAFAPDYIDPTHFIVSIGNWPGEASQFAVKDNAPDPATVSQETGLVKYELAQINYRTPSGFWDRASIVTPITVEPGSITQGCMLVQLTGERTLKAQAFKGTACSSVAGFTDAVVYER